MIRPTYLQLYVAVCGEETEVNVFPTGQTPFSDPENTIRLMRQLSLSHFGFFKACPSRTIHFLFRRLKFSSYFIPSATSDVLFDFPRDVPIPMQYSALLSLSYVRMSEFGNSSLVVQNIRPFDRVEVFKECHIDMSTMRNYHDFGRHVRVLDNCVIIVHGPPPQAPAPPASLVSRDSEDETLMELETADTDVVVVNDPTFPVIYLPVVQYFYYNDLYMKCLDCMILGHVLGLGRHLPDDHPECRERTWNYLSAIRLGPDVKMADVYLKSRDTENLADLDNIFPSITHLTLEHVVLNNFNIFLCKNLVCLRLISVEAPQLFLFEHVKLPKLRELTFILKFQPVVPHRNFTFRNMESIFSNLEKLEIQLTDEYPFTHYIMPNLTSLTLIVHTSSFAEENTIAGWNIMPALKTLKLDVSENCPKINNLFSQSIFPQIEDLSLFGNDYHPHYITWSKFEPMPTLRILEMTGLEFEDDFHIKELFPNVRELEMLEPDVPRPASSRYMYYYRYFGNKGDSDEDESDEPVDSDEYDELSVDMDTPQATQPPPPPQQQQQSASTGIGDVNPFAMTDDEDWKQIE